MWTIFKNWPIKVNCIALKSQKLIEIVTKREIPLNDLKGFYNLAIDNMKNMYAHSDSDKIIKLRKKWDKLYII